ncbi:MAG: hypothetical protein JETCAE01_10150 [Anaerolineaceae bacterium]|nr:MAG: hypothetical protein JETCAE01_10150 [Anaerolineaceae bacterium]
MAAEDCCPEERGGGENQNIFKRHLEALIDPRGARVCGEDDEGDEDEAEEEGEEVFAGEDLFHIFNHEGSRSYTKGELKNLSDTW